MLTSRFNNIGIAVPDTVFTNRRLVELKLTSGKEFFSDSARISISVVKENSLDVSGATQNILVPAVPGFRIHGKCRFTP
jgi:hypothetical protein